MVSLRRRKLLGHCSGRGSFLAPLPRSVEPQTSSASPAQNVRSVAVHPLPSNDINQFEEKPVANARSGSPNLSASGLSKEEQPEPYPGDRHFSPWKGSVVDSVVGVFPTQNVSDHLPSSAFMSLAARFPMKSDKCQDRYEETTSSGADNPNECIPDPNIPRQSKDILNELGCKMGGLTPHVTEQDDKREPAKNDKSSDRASSPKEQRNHRSEDPRSKLKFRDNHNYSLEELLQLHEDTLVYLVNNPEILPASKSSMVYGAECQTQHGKSAESNNRRFVAESVALVGEEAKNYPDAKGDFQSNDRASSPNDRSEDPRSKLKFRDNHKYSLEELLQLHEDTLVYAVNNPLQLHEDTLMYPVNNPEILPASKSSMVYGAESQTQHGKSADCRFVAESERQMKKLEKPALVDEEANNYPDVNDKLLDTAKGDENLVVHYQRNVFKDFKNDSASTTRKEQINDLQHTQSEPLDSNGNNNNSADILDSNLLNTTKSQSHWIDHNPSEQTKINEANRKSKSRRVGIDVQDNFDWDCLRKPVEPSGKKRERLFREHGSIDVEWLRDIPDKAKEYLLSIEGLGLKSMECVRLLTLHQFVQHMAFWAAFMCRREPNFEISEDEKRELRKFKWEDFLAITRNAINNKKTKRRTGSPTKKKSDSNPQSENGNGNQETNSFSSSEEMEQDSSAS